MSATIRLRRLAAAIPNYSPELTLAGVPPGDWFVTVPGVAGGGYVTSESDAGYFQQRGQSIIRHDREGGGLGPLQIISYIGQAVAAVFSFGATAVLSLNVAGQASGNKSVQTAAQAAGLANAAASIGTSVASSSFFNSVGTSTAEVPAAEAVTADGLSTGDFALIGKSIPPLPAAEAVTSGGLSPQEFSTLPNAAGGQAQPAGTFFFDVETSPGILQRFQSLPGVSAADVQKTADVAGKTVKFVEQLTQLASTPSQPLAAPSTPRPATSGLFFFPTAGAGVTLGSDLAPYAVSTATGQPGQIGGGGGGGAQDGGETNARVALAVAVLGLWGLWVFMTPGRRAR